MQRSLDSLWHEFALYNLNRGDLDYYSDWDDLVAGYKLDGSRQPHIEVEVGNRVTRTPLPKDRGVPHLAIRYTSFDFDDDDVRHVTFENFGFTPPTEQNLPGEQDPVEAGYHRIQAWLELADGSSRVEDWTDRSKVSLCRDEPNEDVSRIVLLYSNALPGNYPVTFDSNFVGIRNDGRVTARRACSLPTSWTGPVSGTYVRGDGLTETWGGTLTFTLDFQEPGDSAFYELTAGSLAWEVSGTLDDNGCSFQGSGTLVGGGTGSVTTDPEGYGFNVSSATGSVPVTRSCPAPQGSETVDFEVLRNADWGSFYGGPLSGGETDYKAGDSPIDGTVTRVPAGNPTAA